jgi:hypothetical protein
MSDFTPLDADDEIIADGSAAATAKPSAPPASLTTMDADDEIVADHPASPAQPPALTQDDINTAVRKMLDDPKVSGAQIRAYWTRLGGKLDEHDSAIIDQRDAYIKEHGEAPTIGLDTEHPSSGGEPGLTDNRPYSFGAGVEDGAAHIAENAIGGLGWVGNRIGLDNDLRGDFHDWYHHKTDISPVQGSSAGRLTGEILASAPAVILGAPVEAGAAALGAPAAVAAGAGLLVAGAAQGALSTHADNPVGVARDAAVGAGANLLLGGAAHGLGALAGRPAASTIAGREVLDAADALSRDGITVRPAPADVGSALARRVTGGLNQGLASGSIIRNRASNYIDAIEAAKNRAADSLAPTGESAQPLADTAGELLDQNSLGGYRARARRDANRAYTAAETLSGDPVIPRLPIFERALASKIAELRGVPGADSNPNLRALEGIQEDLTHRGYTVSGLRRLRTDLGRQLDASNPDSREIAGALRRPLADDIDAGLRQQGHHQAADLWQQADTSYAASRRTLDDISKIIGPDHARYNAERVAGRITQMIRGKGGDGELVGRVLDAMEPDQAARVRASVINALGRAKPGNQSATSDVFSPESFLTQWQDENFSPAAKAALIPDAQARQDLENIARVSQGAREAGRYRNHSNTSGALNVLNTLRGTVTGAAALGTAGKSLIAEGIAGAVASSPRVARALVRAGEVRPVARAAQGAAKIGQRATPPIAGYLMNLPRPGDQR